METKKTMTLDEILDMKLDEEDRTSDNEVTFERLDMNMTEIRNKIAFFRKYPDLFIDLIKGEDSVFKFYFYQRVFIRAAMRYKYVYATFPRALIWRQQFFNLDKLL